MSTSLLSTPLRVPPISPECPICGKEMRLITLTPSYKYVVYGYLCQDHRVFEVTIDD